MNGTPEELITDMGNRIMELERLAMQSNQREQELRRNAQELRGRVDEVTRMLMRNQGGGGNARERHISEFKAVLNHRVLTDDRAGHKDWHAKFINVMSQVRPGMRDMLRELETHKDGIHRAGL